MSRRKSLRLVSEDYPAYETDDDTSRERRPKRRSVALRVALSLVTATLLGAGGFGLHQLVRSGVLDPVISPDPVAAAPTPTPAAAATIAAADAAPQPVATQAVADTSPPAPVVASVPVKPAPPAPPPTAPVPDTMGLVIMIRNAFVALDQANATGDYATLWALAAPDFQQRSTPASLTGAFADLRSRNLQLSAINAVDPSLYRPPAIDGDGYLHLAGFFPIDGKQIDFDLTYQTVASRWRLFGMAVHPPKDDSLPPPPDSKSKTKPKPPPSLDAAGKVPPETRLVALIRGAILGLNQGNLTGNYAVMRESAAAGFQAGNDLPHLAAVFAPLRQRQLDLSPVAVIPPALAKPPTIDKNGFLQLLGYFPSRPEQVSFEMVFALERGEWRLFGIGVESSAAPPPSAAAPAAKP